MAFAIRSIQSGSMLIVRLNASGAGVAACSFAARLLHAGQNTQSSCFSQPATVAASSHSSLLSCVITSLARSLVPGFQHSRPSQTNRVSYRVLLIPIVFSPLKYATARPSEDWRERFRQQSRGLGGR